MDAVVSGAARLKAYRTRQVRPLGHETIADHTMKLYALEAEGASVSDGMIAAAREAIASTLSVRRERQHEHRLGFAILHAGEEAIWLLVDRWMNGDALCQTIFRAPLDGPVVFEDQTDRNLLFCVWEGAVVDYERGAFRDTMMCDVPDLKGYLDLSLSSPV